MIRALALFCLAAFPAFAEEEIIAGLSQNRVSITADFAGSEILIYGAVKRDGPMPEGSKLEVLITIEGPSTPITVRKKERRAGIWINTEAVQIGSAPSFYAIATTGPMVEVLTQTEDLRHQITIPKAIRAVGISDQAKDAPGFVEALVRIRQDEDLYRLSENSVSLTQDTLFRTDVILPANLTEGAYRVRMFLTRDGTVVDRLERRINVRKEGLERFLFNLSREQPLIYGLLSLLIAVVAGWGASAAFRLMKA